MRLQWNAIQRLTGKRQNKAQVVLEFTLVLTICMVLLVIGSLQLFIWLNKGLIERQQAYVNTATESDPSVDFYTPAALDIFALGEQ